MAELVDEYGLWALENPECMEMSYTSPNTKTAQLCFCMVCLCQIIWIMGQWPKVGWESIYLPACEMTLYSLAASGNGFIQLADGRIIPYARMAAWICTCPALLMQINGLAKCKLGHFNLNTFQVVADLIMNVMGLNATLTNHTYLKWIYFGIAMVLFGCIMGITHDIFSQTARKWKSVDTPLAQKVAWRVTFLKYLFSLSWSIYPLLWILSPQATCSLREDVISCLHFVSDFFAKNIFGLVMWWTLWRDLDGDWSFEHHYPPDQEQARSSASATHSLPGKSIGLAESINFVKDTQDCHDHDGVYSIEDRAWQLKMVPLDVQESPRPHRKSSIASLEMTDSHLNMGSIIVPVQALQQSFRDPVLRNNEIGRPNGTDGGFIRVDSQQMKNSPRPINMAEKILERHSSGTPVMNSPHGSSAFIAASAPATVSRAATAETRMASGAGEKADGGEGAARSELDAFKARNDEQPEEDELFVLTSATGEKITVKRVQKVEPVPGPSKEVSNSPKLTSFRMPKPNGEVQEGGSAGFNASSYGVAPDLLSPF